MQRSTPHVRVIREGLLADAGGEKVVLRQGDDRFLTAPQIVPERRHRIGTGKSAGHADDRNRVGRQRIRCERVRCHWSRSFSYLSPRRGSLPRRGTLLGSIANIVRALGVVLPAEAELTDEIGREVGQ